MNTNEIFEAINQEILKLQQARAVLADAPVVQAPKPVTIVKRRGRPKGSVNKKAGVATPVATKPARRTMSEESKARIAAAQKMRWAAQKKTVVKPATKKIAPNSAKKILSRPVSSMVISAKPAIKKIAIKVSGKHPVL